MGELKTLLVGVSLPAEKARLLEYAVQQRAEPALLEALQSLPDRRYESIDEVAEELLQIQPHALAPRPRPEPESGGPPGGHDYTRPRPDDTGVLRDHETS